MSTVESTAIRLVGYGAYVTGVAGLAVSTGGWLGWLMLTIAGAIPGGWLLAKDMERRADEREIKRHAPEQLRLPPRPAASGPAPERLTPPSA